MRELYEDLMSFLSRPGKLSKACWREVYEIREKLANADAGVSSLRYRSLALCGMIEVASKTARARRSRLPDSLHNMMILNSGGVKPELEDHVEWWGERVREETARHVQAYVRMLENLPAQKARA